MHDHRIIDEAANKALASNRIGPEKGQVGPEEPEPYHRFLYHLCRLMCPSRALELGVKHGNGVNHMALGHPEASVIGVDIAPQTDGNLPKNVTIVEMRSLDYLRSCRGRPFDIVHIDTEHYPSLVNAEFNTAFKAINRPGVICIDDIFINAEMKRWWTDVSEGTTWLYPGAYFFSDPRLHVTGYGIVWVDGWSGRRE